mmetsp:Transcript_124547/g.248458  ORF Transcript_124547/g.248458 Transcript_124547/m.248458 type:complete len:140 (-) Transcript_124547:664-1083(-)
MPGGVDAERTGLKAAGRSGGRCPAAGAVIPGRIAFAATAGRKTVGRAPGFSGLADASGLKCAKGFAVAGLTGAKTGLMASEEAPAAFGGKKRGRLLGSVDMAAMSGRLIPRVVAGRTATPPLVGVAVPAGFDFSVCAMY